MKVASEDRGYFFCAVLTKFVSSGNLDFLEAFFALKLH